MAGNDIAMLQQIAGLTQPQLNPLLTNNPNDLKKALTTSAGFLGINLEAQAKWLQPVFAGLRRRMPTDTPTIGAASAQYRLQLGYGTFNFGTSMGTAFGNIGASTVSSATTIAATYTSQSINGGVQYEAMVQAQGWDNALNLDTIQALSDLLRLEELTVLGGNNAAISAPSGVTMTASTTHAGPTFASGTWHIQVTALTFQGGLTNASSNSNTGESVVATFSAASGASGCDFFDVLIPYVPGAIGYKVYAELTAGGGVYYLCRPGTEIRYAVADNNGAYNTTAGAAFVFPTGQTYAHVTRLQLYAVPVNTSPTPPGSDGSANANTFEGVISWCEKSTIWGQALSAQAPYVIDQKGIGLTTIPGGIQEFDKVLQTQWVNNHASPSLILCSANSITSFTNKLIGTGTNTIMRINTYQDRNNITGGLYVGGYVNKFATSMIGAPNTIEVWAHPYMPDGTFLFLTENVPVETLPYSRLGKVFALDVPIPYTYLPLGRTDRSFPYTVFYNETLKSYWPTAQSAIVGVRVDS